jgi:hypothetical protein
MTTIDTAVQGPSTSADDGTVSSRGGSGYSERSNAYEAGVEAASEALSQAGGRADLVLLYATSLHDPTLLRDGVRSVVGPTPLLIGGSSVGSITNTRLGYEGYQVGVGAINSERTHFEVFTETRLDVRGEREVGAALGRRIANATHRGEPNLLLMYDMIKKPQTQLNVATHLLDGIGAEIPAWPNVAGVGVFGSMQFTAATQWSGDDVLTQSAIALLISGGVRMDTIIMHGCRPASRYFTVTRSEGARVLEIEGKPALDFIAGLIPDRGWEEYPLFVTLGVNRGDQFGDFREEDYSNHLCMGIDREHGALVMFEPSLTAGMQVQLMRRSIDYDYLSVRVNQLFERVGDRHPFFALYIDCAGRASAFCGSEREEAEEVQRALSQRDVPLLGMFSGVEIAKVGGVPRGLDWTGVLCLFTDER